MCLARGGDTVCDHADYLRAAVVAQSARFPRERFRKRREAAPGRLLSFLRFHGNETCPLAGPPPALEDCVLQVGITLAQRITAGRRRHLDRRKRQFDFRIRIRPAPIVPDNLERFGKGLAGVGFVQQDGRIVGSQPRPNWPCIFVRSVGAKQQARPDLIDRRTDHHRLQRRIRPRALPRYAAAERRRFERGLPSKLAQRARQPSQLGIGFHLVRELLPNAFGSFCGLIHDDPPVYHKKDAARGLRRPHGQCVNGDVDQRRLARGRRQPDSPRPLAVQDLLRKRFLPRKRLTLPKRLKELLEGHFGPPFSGSARNNPYP
ncbi:MAG TPA: hypothetical protein VKX39_05880 [Bryobacteraceae bacterium]|nr:hypothetical protein [Bryobacteraceae bacterium]